MKAEELLNCPFCGSTASFTEDSSPIRERIVWLVGCDSEDCPAMPLICGHARKIDAAKAWNSRAASVDRAGIVRSFVEELGKEFDRNMIDANNAGTYSGHTRKSGFNSGLREASRIAARLVSQYKGEGK